MSVTLVYWRHYARYEVELPSVEDALERAFQDHVHGEAFPIEILDADGFTLVDHDALFDHYCEQPG